MSERRKFIFEPWATSPRWGGDFLDAVGTHLLFRFIARLELTPTDRQVFGVRSGGSEIRSFAYDTILARFERQTGEYNKSRWTPRDPLYIGMCL